MAEIRQRLHESGEVRPDARRRPPIRVKSLVGASLLFQLAISNPNEPIHVEAPQNAQPYPRS